MALRRYKLAFAVYWLLFAIFAIFGAQSPGLVIQPELAPYPWRGLLVMWIFLALAVALFYAILLPPRFRDSYWRLPLALVFGLALFTGSVVTPATDLPGLDYVPLWFSFVTMVMLLVVSASTVVGALWRKFKSAP